MKTVWKFNFVEDPKNYYITGPLRLESALEEVRNQNWGTDIAYLTKVELVDEYDRNSLEAILDTLIEQFPNISKTKALTGDAFDDPIVQDVFEMFLKVSDQTVDPNDLDQNEKMVARILFERFKKFVK